MDARAVTSVGVARRSLGRRGSTHASSPRPRMGAGMAHPCPLPHRPDPDLAVLALAWPCSLRSSRSTSAGTRSRSRRGCWSRRCSSRRAEASARPTVIADHRVPRVDRAGRRHRHVRRAIHVMHVALVAAGGTLAVFTARIAPPARPRARRTPSCSTASAPSGAPGVRLARQRAAGGAAWTRRACSTRSPGWRCPTWPTCAIVDLLEPDGTPQGRRSTRGRPAACRGAARHAHRAPAGPGQRASGRGRARAPGEPRCCAELPEEDLRRFAAQPRAPGADAAAALSARRSWSRSAPAAGRSACCRSCARRTTRRTTSRTSRSRATSPAAPRSRSTTRACSATCSAPRTSSRRS